MIFVFSKLPKKHILIGMDKNPSEIVAKERLKILFLLKVESVDATP